VFGEKLIGWGSGGTMQSDHYQCEGISIAVELPTILTAQ
jgi:hypothetical protein